MKQVHNKQTLLAMGYIILYPFTITENNNRYHFLGLINQEGSSVISCLNDSDLHYRKDCLLEGQYYTLGQDQKDEERLMMIGYDRINKGAFVHPCDISHLKTA